MSREQDTKCPKQKGMVVALKWCERNRHMEFCETSCGGKHPDQSLFQLEKSAKNIQPQIANG